MCIYMPVNLILATTYKHLFPSYDYFKLPNLFLFFLITNTICIIA